MVKAILHLFNLAAMRNPISENPRLVWLGGTLKIISLPHPAMGRNTFHQNRLLQTPSTLSINTSRDFNIWICVIDLKQIFQCTNRHRLDLQSTLNYWRCSRNTRIFLFQLEQLDVALSALVWLIKWRLVKGCTQWSLEVFSNLNESVLLWFHDPLTAQKKCSAHLCWKTEWPRCLLDCHDLRRRMSFIQSGFGPFTTISCSFCSTPLVILIVSTKN